MSESFKGRQLIWKKENAQVKYLDGFRIFINSVNFSSLIWGKTGLSDFVLS